MKKVKVEITGLTPLLMHSPQAMLDKTQKVRKTTQGYDHDKEAEKVAYRSKNETLYIPSIALKRCMINASSWKKFGKYSAKPMIAAGVRLEPREITILNPKNGKPIKDYVIDLQTVVVQRARIVRARPRIDSWKAEFDLLYNDTLIGDSELVKTILEEGGERVGILDFRPEKYGDFGIFKVTKWVEEK